MSGAEVVALLGAILTPILGGYSVLFLALRAQVDGRIKDAEGRIKDRDEEILRLIKERDHNAELLRGERDKAQDMAWQALGAADRSVQATARSAQTTAKALDLIGATTPQRGE